jgi:hypothetical protein
MRLKELREIQQDLVWPDNSSELPVVSWAECADLVPCRWFCRC